MTTTDRDSRIYRWMVCLAAFICGEAIHDHQYLVSALAAVVVVALFTSPSGR